MYEKTEKLIAIFKKYGGKAQLSALNKGTKYENDIEIKEQPTGLTMGFEGLCHLVNSRNREGRQVFSISTVATWLTLNRAEEYRKQLSIAIAVLREIQAIDSSLVGGVEITTN